MKDSIVFILQLPFKIYVFGQIYLFWVNRLYPELQKHYLNAKIDVDARGKGHLTSKRFLPNLEQHLIMPKSNSPFWKNHSFTSNSNSPHWKNYFFMPISLTPFWNKYFFTSNSHSPLWKNHFSTSNGNSPHWKKHFFMSKSLIPVLKLPFCTLKIVFAAVLIFIIKSWNRVYVHLQIYYSALKSLSAALLIYIKASIRNSPFLHRNFPMIMRYIINRKQHVSSRL